MKKLTLFSIILLFLAATFQSHNPPGWYQVPIPVTNPITGISFTDSLTGFLITDWTDSAYILKTTNGGANWQIKNRGLYSFFAIQFITPTVGYACGGNGNGLVFKTTNQGEDWVTINPFGSGVNSFQDVKFANKDTGWVCSSSSIGGGIFKTTNGGSNWVRQMDDTHRPTRMFFLNKDTGWAVNQNPNGQLFHTINGGVNWDVQYTFPTQMKDVYFFNRNTGIVSGGVSFRTTNGGNNWMQSNDGGVYLSFANDSIGWAGNNFNTIIKTSNGGVTWGRQNSPAFNNFYTKAIDTNIAWAGGAGIVHTTDGGGPVTYVGINATELNIPKLYQLYQNYPNPFNPSTKIKYELYQAAHVKIEVYNSLGKKISVLADERKNEGSYEVSFNGANLSSGVYFYTITFDRGKDIYIDSKKMLLVK